MDKSIIDSYKSVKAPDSLKERLYELDVSKEKSAKRNRLLRFVSSGVAACFIIAAVLTLVLRTNSNSVSLTYSDSVVGTSPVAISVENAEPVAFGMKSIVYSGIPFRLSVNDESKVSVSDGTLYVFNSKTEELVSVVTDITLTEDAIIRWDVSEATNTKPKLSVEANGENYVYVLTFKNGNYFICLDN